MPRRRHSRLESRLRALTALAAAAVLASGVAVAAARMGRPGAASPAAAAGRSAPATTVRAPDQAQVTGSVTLLTATDAVGPPLALPVTVTVAQRGQGDLTISGVTVAGRAVAIVWDAGQPLPLSGTGALDLGPVGVQADAGGITWSLDGANRRLTPGRYVAGAPVAIGSGGLAEPLATVGFEAGAAAGFRTSGAAQVHQPPGPLDLTGPGLVALRGSLRIRTAAGTRTATAVQFGPGPFVLQLHPSGGGYVIDAFFQGPLS